MGIFDRIKEPVILKEDSSAKEQLDALEKLLMETKNLKIKSALENDIAAVKAGILGEDTILFELKNSHIPMFILHDLYLEYEGLSAQIDFLIITRRRHFVVECKNLYGNITINEAGDFIRTIGNRKEGIYSPVTQSKRHLELIKQIRSAERGNVLTRSLLEQYFYDNYRSVVVLANPKTILNEKYAPKEIKNQVIRADQLIKYLIKVNKERDAIDSSESSMEQLAKYFLSKHCNSKIDYTEKYRTLIKEEQEKEQTQSSFINTTENDAVPICPRCGALMTKRKASKGDNIGNEFWGCSNYPKCRGIINIL
ncbi:NERD domain-containing protein [Sinanaerobacter chloroacetimidivorans]|uniref:NERD domain-containing protein n=1 Tax=Sinanaerobacter chloroacetimidivorans TaxID=2818044 RepID=A0A8J7W0H7_9FIRM|nr:NERD domain-containing protein [Sinanaerobacter chloroacetimidivorans]MBR0596941.1 NERD domain-containing protein [Sinanaerobacter chloroacetimidivorans]